MRGRQEDSAYELGSERVVAAHPRARPAFAIVSVVGCWRRVRMSETVETLRTAEVVAACCLATDLGMGLPFEHGLHATLTAMRLGEFLAVDRHTATQTYYCSLLMYSGCTTDAATLVDLLGGSATDTGGATVFGSPLQALAGLVRAIPSPDSLPSRRAYELVSGLPKLLLFARPHTRAVCEVAEMLAHRLGLPPSIQQMFPLLTERWDGHGLLRRAAGEELPLALRIAHVAHDACYQRLIGDDVHAADTVRARAGHAFDPAVALRFAENAAQVMAVLDSPESAWEAILDVEPRPQLSLQGTAIDRALSAVGDFADLLLPWLSGHSANVARLAAGGAERAGMDRTDVALVRRAGLLHDVGRVAVHPRIWAKPGRLTANEWEQVRLHAYHSERILHRAPTLAPAGRVAGAHHERLDGSGYHRGATAASLPATARLVAAADAFATKTEWRPHREALAPEEVAELLRRETAAGRHDPDLLAAVLETAGQPVPSLPRPAGLTERETQVVRLLARGHQTKQVANALDISVKTADHHLQSAYRKMGVSSRAAATLFAMEHGLVTRENSP